MNFNFIFVLNNQVEFKVAFNRLLLDKLEDSICYQLLNSRKYYVNSKVSQESFQAFLNYLNDENKTPELTVNNYYEFLLLSEEFNGNLREYLSKEEFAKIKFLSILKM